MRLLTLFLFITSFCFGQGGSHHTLLGHSPDQLVLNTANSYFFDSSQVEAMESQPSIELYVQGTFYRNGTTNIAYSRDNVAPYNQGGSFFRYDTGYGLRVPYPGINRNDASDNHALSTMFFSEDSLRYYAFRTDPHQSPIYIYKARNDDDVSAWQNLFAATGDIIGAGLQLGYPKVFPDNTDNGVSWARNRIGAVSYGTNQFRASNGGETWGGATQLIETINEGLGYRIYPTMPLRYKANGWYFLEAYYRETDVTYSKKYLLKTQNFEDYYNFDESFSVDITSSAITFAQLESDYKIYENPLGYQSYLQPSSLDENGNYYTIVADTVGGPYHILYNTGGGWLTKTISFPGEVLVDTALVGQELSPFSNLIVYNVNSFDLIVRCMVDVSGTDYVHLKLYRTYNFGDTFVLIGDLNNGIAHNFFRSTWPFNYYDIPVNKNFAVAMFTTDTSPSGALITTLSKGAPEIDYPDNWNVSTITNLSDINGLVRHYRVSASDISKTGTTLTGMNDLSGGGFNITTVNGSPVVNDATTPTYLILDGTNDYLDVPSTNIFTLATGTIFGVIRHKPSNTAGAYVLSAGASSTARYNSFGSNQTFAGSAIMANLTNGHGALVKGQTSITSNTDFAIIAMMCDGENTTLYVNGVRQYMEIGSNGGTDLVARSDARILYSGLASLNRLSIGALRRSTTTYSSFDFKELAFYNRSLSEQEIMEVFKKLGEDHSITVDTSILDW